MKNIILLAMHGAPPRDFPRSEMTELFELRAQLKHAQQGPPVLLRRHAELDSKIRRWPRTPENDPFHAGSQELARHLGRETGSVVIVGFNEFCAPGMDEALDQAAAEAKPAGKIVVITPMMTQGGEHSKSDIPSAIRAAEQRHPGVQITYAWPFDFEEVARFLASQMKRFS